MTDIVPARKQENAQRETALLAEWLTTLPRAWKTKTNVKVGSDPLLYAGVRLTPAQSRAFSSWSNRADARVVTPQGIWLVEAKLVATGAAYGELYDYLGQYPTGDDYQQFEGMPVSGVVVCQASRPRCAARFAPWGINTVVFQPSWSVASALEKLFPHAQVLENPPALAEEIGTGSAVVPPEP